ncbi:exodeoxyribonuclease VII small subunit [Crenalkalicoccus roseus]|uniref:exodeoxyribonuclease VII small subunit n=1 Tax=Crenalkalicoccus roseus TaxID=1485588 RepID=UPI001F026174|nr:exodeoxyribonuclease VII small subunit [Crenalkalicoccus roseus]
MPEGRSEAAMPPREIGALSFEDALAELEAIVSRLEQGKGTLAEAIADYERGTALRKHCEARLSEAEARVQAIVEGASGPGLRDAE